MGIYSIYVCSRDSGDVAMMFETFVTFLGILLALHVYMLSTVKNNDPTIHIFGILIMGIILIVPYSYVFGNTVIIFYEMGYALDFVLTDIERCAAGGNIGGGDISDCAYSNWGIVLFFGSGTLLFILSIVVGRHMNRLL